MLRLRTWAETGLCTHWDLADVNNLYYANEQKKKRRRRRVLSRPEIRTQWEVAKGCGTAGNRKIVSSGLEQDIQQTSSREAANNEEPRGPMRRGQKVAKREFKTECSQPLSEECEQGIRDLASGETCPLQIYF